MWLIPLPVARPASTGIEEGTKDRPCVVIVAVTREDGDTMVTVAPVTHVPPRVAGEGVEIPSATKSRLGLDDGRSWIVVTEINRFRWRDQTSAHCPVNRLAPIPTACCHRACSGRSRRGLGDGCGHGSYVLRREDRR